MAPLSVIMGQGAAVPAQRGCSGVTVALAAAEGQMEAPSISVILVQDGEYPVQANHYCSVLTE